MLADVGWVGIQGQQEGTAHGCSVCF